MMKVELRAGTLADLPGLEPLWKALYEQQRQTGMLVTVPADGFAAWVRTVEMSLERFSRIVLATLGDEPVGFVTARIRNLPAYFGGDRSGFISEVFVSENARGQGVGERMCRAAEEWFAANGVKRIELQVVMSNESARRLYRRLGWQDELVQMVKQLR